MRPTNEERREVAAKLRDAKKLWWPIDVPEQRCRSEVWQEFEKSIGASDAGTYNEVFAFVADLIEPEPERTCRDIAEPPKGGGFWPAPHFKCSECGGEHVSIDYVSYCPKCGAKVVGDE